MSTSKNPPAGKRTFAYCEPAAPPVTSASPLALTAMERAGVPVGVTSVAALGSVRSSSVTLPSLPVIQTRFPVASAWTGLPYCTLCCADWSGPSLAAVTQ